MVMYNNGSFQLKFCACTTTAGKCVASQVRATFFSISASSLTSKWVNLWQLHVCRPSIQSIAYTQTLAHTSTYMSMYPHLLSFCYMPTGGRGREDGEGTICSGQVLSASSHIHWRDWLTTLSTKWQWTRVIAAHQDRIPCPTGTSHTRGWFCVWEREREREREREEKRGKEKGGWKEEEERWYMYKCWSQWFNSLGWSHYQWWWPIAGNRSHQQASGDWWSCQEASSQEALHSPARCRGKETDSLKSDETATFLP